MTNAIVKITIQQIGAAVVSAEQVFTQLSTLQATAKVASATFAGAVQQIAPLEGGTTFKPLSDVLAEMNVPATTGRLRRMVELMESAGTDWHGAYNMTTEDAQSADGEGKRTRAYETVKKARQRLVKAVEKVQEEAAAARNEAANAQRETEAAAQRTAAALAATEAAAKKHSEELAAATQRGIEEAQNAARVDQLNMVRELEELRLKLAELEATNKTLAAENEALKKATPARKKA